MLPKSTKANDSPQDLSTATLLECLVDRAKKHDDTLALLTEALLKQQKQSTTKGRYNPWGLPLPKAVDLPRFQGPLSDADGVLTHLCRLQQVLRTHALLTPSDDVEVEEKHRMTVIELANNSIECAGLVSWVEQDGHCMETDGTTTWEAWSAAFKAKAMPAHWEFRISRTLFRLSFREVSPEAWRTFDNAVILHCSHLLSTSRYPSDSQIADLYRASCPEGLFLHLVGEPEFHVDDLDRLRTLISNHVDRIQHEHAASQSSRSTTKTTSDNVQLPHTISYYHDPAHALPYYLSPLGHQHPKCPTRTRTSTPKVHHLETELTAGDATSVYLTLAQTLPSADDGDGDAMYALFHPLLSISVPVPADDSLPNPSPKFLLDTGASTTFVDPKLAARLRWDVRKGTVRMRVRLAGGMAGPLVTDTVVGSFSLGGRMYSINGVVMDLHGTYDSILGLNFLAQHGLLADSDSLARLLKASSTDLVGLGMRESGMLVPPTATNSVSATAMLSNADTHTTQLPTCAAAESASLTDVLCHLQAEFHDIFCDDLGDVRNFPTISRTKSGIRFEINLKQGTTPHHSVPYHVPEALLPRVGTVGASLRSDSVR
ncbi:hypothetical protein C359_06003 [Cryptococcus neoformans Bt120]|nr:hypothetical protein C359_06003 [Cryptococcus neoformans var. grubii Bt120]